jgi:hypothetical protein
MTVQTTENHNTLKDKIIRFLNIRKEPKSMVYLDKTHETLSNNPLYTEFIDELSQYVQESDQNHSLEKKKLKQTMAEILKSFNQIQYHNNNHAKCDVVLSKLITKQFVKFEEELSSIKVSDYVISLLHNKSKQISQLLIHAKTEREKIISEQNKTIESLTQEIQSLKTKLKEIGKSSKKSMISAIAVIAIDDIHIINKEKEMDLYHSIEKYIENLIHDTQKKFPYTSIKQNGNEYTLFFDSTKSDIALKITTEFKNTLERVNVKFKNRKERISVSGGFYHLQNEIDESLGYQHALNLLQESKNSDTHYIFKNV